MMGIDLVGYGSSRQQHDFLECCVLEVKSVASKRISTFVIWKGEIARVDGWNPGSVTPTCFTVVDSIDEDCISVDSRCQVTVANGWIVPSVARQTVRFKCIRIIADIDRIGFIGTLIKYSFIQSGAP